MEQPFFPRGKKARVGCTGISPVFASIAGMNLSCASAWHTVVVCSDVARRRRFERPVEGIIATYQALTSDARHERVTEKGHCGPLGHSSQSGSIDGRRLEVGWASEPVGQPPKSTATRARESAICFARERFAGRQFRQRFATKAAMVLVDGQGVLGWLADSPWPPDGYIGATVVARRLLVFGHSCGGGPHANRPYTPTHQRRLRASAGKKSPSRIAISRAHH